VLSINKWIGPSGRIQPLEMASIFLALRLKVLWSGVLRGTPSSPKMEAINPSIWRNAR
jgi:hypothetical protein